MDRLTQLRGQAGGSRDSTLDTTSPPSEAYITANDGSKYFSLSEEDSTFDITPIKDVSLASAANPEKAVTDELISNLSPIPKKNDLLDGYKIGKQIDAANILSGEVDLFDNDNSYDGNELVIDDNVELEEKSNPELKLSEAEELSFQKNEDLSELTLVDSEPIASKDTEVVLQIDGKNVNAIDIGNGLYLYRREGEEELAAVQIIDDDQQQPSFKFLKVRENAEGNLEVYEEIEVAKEVPIKEAKTTGKSASHVPIKNINKVINDPTSNIIEKKIDLSQEVQCPNTPTNETSSDPKKNFVNEPKAESNLNGDMTKFNETRKSPVIHSTPNKEGIPLTKTMVNQQLHPNRHSDNVKTIELHTDTKHKQTDVTVKCKESERKKLSLDDIQKEDSDLKMTDKLEQNIHKLTPDDIQKGDLDLNMPDKTEQNMQKISENVEKEDLKTADSEQKELKISESKNNDHDSTAQVDKVEASELSSPGKVFTDTTSNTNDAVKDENSTKSVAIQLDDNLSEKIEVSSLATRLCENITSQVMAALKDKTEMQEMVEKQLEFVADSTPEKVKLSDIKLNDDVNKKDIKVSNDENQLTEYKHQENNTTLETSQPNDKPKTEETVLTELENDKKSNEHEKNIDVPLITITTDQETKVENENILKNESATKNENTSTSCNQILIKNSIPDTKSLPTNVVEAKKVLSNEIVDKTSKDLAIVLKTPIDSKNTIEVSGETPVKKSPAVKNKTEISDANVITPPVIAKVETPDNVFMQQAKVDKDIQDTNKIGIDCDKVSQDTKITKNQMKLLHLSQDLTTQPTSSTTILKSGFESVKQRQNKQEDSNVRLPKGENVINQKSQVLTLSQNVAKPTSSAKLPIHAGLDQHGSKAKVTTTLISKNRPENIAKVSGVPTVDLDNNSKVEYKNKLPQKEITKQINIPLHVPRTTDTKTNIKKVETKTVNTDQKPINNNNAAVPFGQWTEANRQEFLNKIKESKIPTNSSSSCSKQLKQPNDLNRRDVLQKIDSQRQTNSAMTKIQDSKSKLIVKPETKSFSNKPAIQESKTKPPIQETKPPIKTEQTAIRTARPVIIDKKIAKQEILPKTFTLKDMPNTVFSSSPTEKKEPTQRKEINNQDLIDKTIEGIINKALPPKQDEKRQEPITTTTKNIKGITIISHQTKETNPTSLDDIEMKMNELHGIPFVERPLHELPHVFGNEVKIYAKSENSKAVLSKDSKIPNLLPFTNKKQSEKDDVVEIDSEEEIIEHEPITGDIVVNKNTMSPTQSKTGNCSSMSTQSNSCASNKAPIITENEFEKFARRNSITYENCLSVKYDANQPSNVVQTVVEKEVPVKKISRNEQLLAEAKVKSTIKQQQQHQSLRPTPKHQNKIHITSKVVPLTDDSLNKNYHSKLQLAYQSALTAKRQKESPITIIEDKPVKVVFMDSNSEFMSKPLNIQGSQLSPKKRQLPEPEVNNDSVDSDILEVMNEGKSDEIKFKAKHQRKQVLTPVETPDLELIEPKDLVLAEEVSPKKKRKTDDVKVEKSSKLLLPKKTYLLGRGAPAEDKQPISQDVNKIILTENVIQSSIVSHNTASAIDNLVKAAELLENQSETLNASASSTSNSTAQGTPVKRGRGRPRKYPLPEGSEQGKAKAPSPQKKPRLIDSKKPKITTDTTDDDDNDDASTDDEIVRENWTMGKINEDIVCPICSKLFRSENVVYKHVKHCTGPSPSRSDSDKRSLRRSRQSRESERKSLDSDSDDMEPEKLKSKRESPKKRKSKASSDASVNKEEVIVIEDSPAVEKPKQAPRKPGRPRIHPLNAKIECEICGKSFRQMSYLVNHRLLHKKEGTNQTDNSNNGSNSVFSCEVCKKEFRKLHHLVQHRVIHNSSSAPAKPSRKSSAEQNENKSSKDKELAKQSDDQSAAFRCEPCDKSFRKLHHLVEHRETHDGINRQKNPTVTTSTDKPVTDPPQCDVCKKTFRKLHHLIEHKEQHQETSSEKSDDKSVKSSLSARDIIHECSLCYMVFPNEHSLNKHSVFCQRKKKQSAAKQAKTEDETESKESNEIPEKEENNSEVEQTEVGHKIKALIIEPVIKNIEQTSEATVVEKVQKVINVTEKRLSKESDVKHVESVKPSEPLTTSEQKMSPKKRDFSETVIAKTDNESVIPAKLQKVEEKVKENKKIDETPKKKTVSKDKLSSTISKPRRSTNVPLPVVKDERAAPESSDEDDVRYMLNPDFKDEKEIENTFMKVRADKRNSLQVERPNSKELVKRRISLQHPPKVPRTKPKPIETRKPSSNAQKVTKIETAPATDSDDSDVKYSFPKTATEKAVKTEDTASVKPKEVPKTPKDKKRAKMEKRKTLSGIAKRKSVGKILTTQVKDKPSPTKQIKRRPVEAGHRCDCGQLFGSAALLARHATLAHTPPRVRRERAPPEPVSKPPKSVDKTTPKKPQRKSTETTKTPPTRKSVKSAPEPTRTSAKTRNAAHRGVPVPDKMKKLLEKGKK